MTDPAVHSPSSVSAPRARAWPVFRIFIAAMVLGAAATLLTALLVSAIFPDAPRSYQPLLLMAQLAPMQAVLIVSAFMAARAHGRQAPASLGLVRAGLGPGGWALVLGGTGVPFAVGMVLASRLPSLGGNDEILQMWQTMSAPIAFAWVLFVGLVPGACEEIFFRGLIQRRLAAAWPPVAAIGTTAMLFGLVHLDPQVIALAFVLGVWLGVIAWRTGSTWPGIIAHASINGLWNAAQIVVNQTNPDSRMVWILVIALGIISLVCFVGAVILLKRRGAAEDATAAPG